MYYRWHRRMLKLRLKPNIRNNSARQKQSRHFSVWEQIHCAVARRPLATVEKEIGGEENNIQYFICA